jgi:hypothetical protein
MSKLFKRKLSLIKFFSIFEVHDNHLFRKVIVDIVRSIGISEFLFKYKIYGDTIDAK